MPANIKNILNLIMEDTQVDETYSFEYDIQLEIRKWQHSLPDNTIFHSSRKQFDVLDRNARYSPDTLGDERAFHFSNDPLLGADFIRRGEGYIYAYRANKRKFFPLGADLEWFRPLSILYYLNNNMRDQLTPYVQHKIDSIIDVINRKKMDKKHDIYDKNYKYYGFLLNVEVFVERLFVDDGYYGYSYHNRFEGDNSDADDDMSYAVFDGMLDQIEMISVFKVNKNEASAISNY